MEALRRNVQELTERMTRLDVLQMRTAGQNEALTTVMSSLIETHPDLDALAAAIHFHRPDNLPIIDPQARAFCQTLDLSEAMIQRERFRRKGAE